jgi:hypothetical protein
VLAGIGELWDTVESRSIRIEMRRKLPCEEVEPFRERRVRKDAAPIAEALQGWTNGKVADLLQPIEVTDVPGLGDRQMDMSEPLLQIAQLAGGDWPEELIEALQAIFGVLRDEDGSISTMLLRDIRSIFKEKKVERIFSRDLAAALCALEGQPWQDWAKGNGLTPSRLAKQLHPFRIYSKTVDIGRDSAKGYDADQFKDAWSRYTPPVENVEASKPASPLNETLFSKRREKEEPTFRKASEASASTNVRRSDVSKAGGTQDDTAPQVPVTGANGKPKDASGDARKWQQQPAQAPADDDEERI